MMINNFLLWNCGEWSIVEYRDNICECCGQSKGKQWIKECNK